MAISEEDGQKFYLICGKEKLFESSVEGEILQINVSRSGYVSIIISNASYKSIVEIFNKSGKEVFRTNLVTSRVVDVSISQDGKYLAIAELDLSGIIIQSSIQIISMEMAQTKPAEAMLYKYEDVKIRQLFDKLQCNRTLPRNDVFVVEGMQEGVPFFVAQFKRLLIRIIVNTIYKANLRAIAFGCFHLRNGRTARQADDRFNTTLLRLAVRRTHQE